MSSLRWITRDGKRVKLSEMEDSHLANSLRLLERQRSNLEHTSDLLITFNRFLDEFPGVPDSHGLDRDLEVEDVQHQYDLWIGYFEKEIKKRANRKTKKVPIPRVPIPKTLNFPIPKIKNDYVSKGTVSQLGRCCFPQCSEIAIVSYPLVHNEPSFCGEHYKKSIVEKFGCEM